MQKAVNCTTVWNLKRPKTYQMTIIRDLIELTKVYSHSEVLANCKKEWSISLYPSMETSVEYMIKQKKKQSEENNVQFTSISLTRRNVTYMYKCNICVFHSSVQAMAE